MSDKQPPIEPIENLKPLEFEAFSEDEVDLKELIAKKERKPLSRLNKVLVGALGLVIAFFAGSLVQQHFGPSSSNSAFPGGGGFGAGRFPGGGNPFAGGGSGATNVPGGAGLTIGTITLVDGTHVYVTDASGQIVKVNVSPSTAITAQASIPPSKLKSGEQVIVRGAAGTDGTVAATTITQGSLPNAALTPANGAGQ